MALKVGDIVQLKSGGPKMTVQSGTEEEEGHVWCQWFAGSKLEQGRFPVESLVKVAPEDAGQKKK